MDRKFCDLCDDEMFKPIKVHIVIEDPTIAKVADMDAEVCSHSCCVRIAILMLQYGSSPVKTRARFRKTITPIL